MIDQAPGPYPIWLTLFTAMFLHGSPLHLAGNMLFLWIFGDNVEEVLGTFRYLLVYLACGLIGSILQIAASPNSLVPTLGASGAIAGVMGAYVDLVPAQPGAGAGLPVHHGDARAAGHRALDRRCRSGRASGRSAGSAKAGGVAYLAHVGGALTGIFVAFLFRDRAEHLRSLHEARKVGFTDRTSREAIMPLREPL